MPVQFYSYDVPTAKVAGYPNWLNRGVGGLKMTMPRNSRILWTIPLLIAVCLVSTPAEAKYGGGTGEPNDPYQIATAEDLMLLGESPEDYDKHFILTADIDLDPNLPGRKVFDAAVIGVSPETPFVGVFDGNGHTILHLTAGGGFWWWSGDFLGLFGVLGSGASVSNLGLEAVEVYGNMCVGGLAGSNGGSITASYCTGTVSGGTYIYVGGLVGSNGGSITASYSTCTVTGHQNVGGLVGYNGGNITASSSTGTVSGSFWSVGGLVGYNIGIITSSYGTGTVNGTNDVGGLVGSNDYLPGLEEVQGIITSCYSVGSVTGYDWVGGLVGMNRHSSISGSYSTGTVNGTNLVGGLVGWNDHGSITTSYGTATVNGGTRVGGLVGYSSGSITMSYSTGAITGGEDVGGLVGRNRGSSAVVSICFWDIETSGLLNMCGSQLDDAMGCDDSYGKTTDEMQVAGTFLDADWDFVDIWGIGENQTYPYLRKYSAADINQDETINFPDLAILSENWLAGDTP
jgi:hypothetical protein